ncbi:unnamed protein product, partial [Laminaria digitata]
KISHVGGEDATRRESVVVDGKTGEESMNKSDRDGDIGDAAGGGAAGGDAYSVGGGYAGGDARGEA